MNIKNIIRSTPIVYDGNVTIKGFCDSKNLRSTIHGHPGVSEFKVNVVNEYERDRSDSKVGSSWNEGPLCHLVFHFVFDRWRSTKSYQGPFLSLHPSSRGKSRSNLSSGL